MARRTKAEAAQTREAVLDAAICVFLERGVARTTLDEVARAAGVTRGAVYWHFRDKLDLFLAVDERGHLPLEELLARLRGQDGRDPIGDLADAMVDGLAALAADHLRHRVLTILLLRCEYTADMAPAIERQRAVDAQVHAAFLVVFQKAEAIGQLHPAWTPENAARALQALACGLVHTWLRNPDGFQFSVEAGLAVRGFLQGMRQPIREAVPEDMAAG